MLYIRKYSTINAGKADAPGDSDGDERMDDRENNNL